MAEETNPCKLVTEEQLIKVFEGTNFGNRRTPREIVDNTVLQIAGGYSTGHTAYSVCRKLKLCGCMKKDRTINLTKKGRRYLYWTYERKTQ